ncbi:hypothetical protein M514_22408 [Trichuris suis]|uniref:Uncharacterized protein n=1 Tax=Trichuris suis TaxID=68888 RepID=A0A085N7C2_9BILA|nr:hypothetical protein M514_22408 [Trichuris suis]
MRFVAMCNGLELLRFHLDLNSLLFSCNPATTVEIVKTSNGLQCGIGRNVKGPHTAQDRNSEILNIPHGSYGPTGRNLVTSES